MSVEYNDDPCLWSVKYKNITTLEITPGAIILQRRFVRYRGYLREWVLVMISNG
ncbi:hypothetical protein Plhal304r1_c087g0170041 [Plasmopara halstedii]